ncbi:hypothetical protein [Streptomyces sp. NPDC005805]|uniref:hypothetical protein n=1 Tax=Streptomyces sp. NPDC005805 TaxID=3157068 RepID=UPI0033EF1258
MTEPLEPAHADAARDARHRVQALVDDLTATHGDPADALLRAQLSGLRTVLCLLRAGERAVPRPERLTLLRRARTHARSTTVLTSCALGETTLLQRS